MQPKDSNFRDLLKICQTGEVNFSALDPKDREYFERLCAAVNAGKAAVIIVEEGDKLKYMFSNASRGEAVSMIGRVLEANGRRLTEGEA